MGIITEKSLLYERAKEEYEQFIDQLTMLNDEEIACRLHECILKSIALGLIENGVYTYKEKKFLMNQSDPLETLYRILRHLL